MKEFDDYCKEMDETFQSIAALEEEEDEEGVEMERAAPGWKKALEAVKKCQELISSGQGNLRTCVYNIMSYIVSMMCMVHTLCFIGQMCHQNWRD